MKIKCAPPQKKTVSQFHITKYYAKFLKIIRVLILFIPQCFKKSYKI